MIEKMILSGCRAVKSMPIPSISVSWKSGDGVSDQFPVGLRVLVVDDDPTCLKILEKMLRNCLYEVTKCNRAEIALLLLRENKNGFDIVISDVHMPDMDGFKLLEHIGQEMDLPVIMMSADDSQNVVMKGVTHGVCDYLIKPVRIEALKNIWQHVVRKRKHEWRDFEQSGSMEEGERPPKPDEDVDYSSSAATDGNCRTSKRRKDEEDEAEEGDDSSTLKKPRVVWSVELHQQFVAAVNQLGIDKAVPKKILELMNVPGLTRENVASHLQKYRLYLRRLSGVSQHQAGLNSSFLGPPDATFGSLSSFNGLDLQALAATGQLSAQSLATLQAAALSRSAPKSAIPMPIVDQRNLFSFESPKLRFDHGQQQQQLQVNNRSEELNRLHGIPTNMEPKQLSNMHQCPQSLRGMNIQVNSQQGSGGSSLLAQTGQSQTRALLPNETNGGSHVSRTPSSVGQPVLSNGIAAGGVVTRGVMVDNVRAAVYKPVSQTHPKVNVSTNHVADLPGHGFPVVTIPGMIQGEISSEMKESKGLGFAPSYDIFNELHKHKSQDWGYPSVGFTSHHASAEGSLDISPSASVQQGFPCRQKIGHNGNQSFRADDAGRAAAANVDQQFNTPLQADTSLWIKAERFPNPSSQNNLFHDQYGQDDLMSALLEQQQDGIAPVENEFGFDGYPLDDLPV